MAVYIRDEDYATAAEKGISKSTVYNRVYVLGWDVKKAITKPVPKRDEKRLKYRAVADAHGISRWLYYDRLREGWGYEEAATTPKCTTIEEKIRAFRQKSKRAVLTEEQVEIYKKNGIPYGTVIRRIRFYGWDADRAVTEPVHTQYRRHDLRDKKEEVSGVSSTRSEVMERVASVTPLVKGATSTVYSKSKDEKPNSTATRDAVLTGLAVESVTNSVLDM
ncbi:MAG: hypothetical protein ACI35P_01600 [Bacillus sp. (in: firmicutes)]